ncbi:MAG: TetR/AcrR family transcriptional regulator [Alphaproteobacteria bacterium]|nr:TetR/AcrR family transcriptional regulator [Alphaproteobacteria bacterium]
MPKPRGRPRSFDEPEVRARMMQLFWEKGYSATSLNDLCEATGLTRPSLYNSFGPKQEMYLAALDLFTARMRERVLAAVGGAGSLEEALAALFLGVMALYYEANEGEPLGCMLFGTAVVEAPSHPEIREALQARIARVEAMLRAVFARFQPEACPEAAQLGAQLAGATLQSIAIRARAGFPREDLTRFARASAAALARLV